jgi:TRAP-type C4-dicarboxylate transport system permease small subunit
VATHLLTLYVLWLFFSGSWTQTKIGMTTYSTVLHYPNALKAAAGLFCAGSMLFIVGLNLARILIGSPDAHVPGEPAASPNQTPAAAAAGTAKGAQP